MNIVYMDPGSLKPYGKNHKKHPKKQIEALADEITRNGFDMPVVCDQDHVIIKGHGRVEAAKLAGVELIPVVVKTISKNEARMMRIVDNEVHSTIWDNDLLSAEIDDLLNLGVPEDHLLVSSGKETIEVGYSSGVVELPDVALDHKCPSCGYEW